jgi:hypothetical protein
MMDHRSTAAAVVMGFLIVWSHLEKTSLLVIVTLRRWYICFKKVERTSVQLRKSMRRDRGKPWGQKTIFGSRIVIYCGYLHG